MSEVWDTAVAAVALASSMPCLNYPPARTVSGATLLSETRRFSGSASSGPEQHLLLATLATLGVFPPCKHS